MLTNIVNKNNKKRNLQKLIAHDLKLNWLKYEFFLFYRFVWKVENENFSWK